MAASNSRPAASWRPTTVPMTSSVRMRMATLCDRSRSQPRTIPATYARADLREARRAANCEVLTRLRIATRLARLARRWVAGQAHRPTLVPVVAVGSAPLARPAASSRSRCSSPPPSRRRAAVAGPHGRSTLRTRRTMRHQPKLEPVSHSSGVPSSVKHAACEPIVEDLPIVAARVTFKALG
jgi:hypothetical protein